MSKLQTLLEKEAPMSPNDLTHYARLGYHGLDNPHLYSSAVYIAHMLGRHMQTKGMTEPKQVRMSRGYNIRAGDMLFRWIDDHFERLK